MKGTLMGGQKWDRYKVNEGPEEELTHEMAVMMGLAEVDDAPAEPVTLSESEEGSSEESLEEAGVGVGIFGRKYQRLSKPQIMGPYWVYVVPNVSSVKDAKKAEKRALSAARKYDSSANFEYSHGDRAMPALNPIAIDAEGQDLKKIRDDKGFRIVKESPRPVDNAMWNKPWAHKIKFYESEEPRKTLGELMSEGLNASNAAQRMAKDLGKELGRAKPGTGLRFLIPDVEKGSGRVYLHFNKKDKGSKANSIHVTFYGIGEPARIQIPALRIDMDVEQPGKVGLALAKLLRSPKVSKWAEKLTWRGEDPFAALESEEEGEFSLEEGVRIPKLPRLTKEQLAKYDQDAKPLLKKAEKIFKLRFGYDGKDPREIARLKKAWDAAKKTLVIVFSPGGEKVVKRYEDAWLKSLQKMESSEMTEIAELMESIQPVEMVGRGLSSLLDCLEQGEESG